MQFVVDFDPDPPSIRTREVMNLRKKAEDLTRIFAACDAERMALKKRVAQQQKQITLSHQMLHSFNMSMEALYAGSEVSDVSLN